VAIEQSGSPRCKGAQRVTGQQVFLSYSHNDLAAATALRDRLAVRGLSVFFDKTELRAGDRWLDRLQAAVDGCGAFVVLVGRDGVARWVGAETQAALNRHFGARGDADRLPIFPVLLEGDRRRCAAGVPPAVPGDGVGRRVAAG